MSINVGGSMNILILSAETRDKVVQYFKQALAGDGKVVTTDCNPYAPALYEGDRDILSIHPDGPQGS